MLFTRLITQKKTVNNNVIDINIKKLFNTQQKRYNEKQCQFKIMPY